MASMKVLLLLLGFAGLAVGQYRPITGPEERALELGQNPALLELAAMTGEMVVVIIDGPSVTTIVQEGVNYAISCLRWLQRFPGGSIQWKRRLLTTDGDLTDEQSDISLGDSQLVISGQFSEWLNISRTILSSGAETPHSAIYMCEVCLFRGTAFPECHTANVTLAGLGGPPFIDKAFNNTAESETNTQVVYKIGADFCIPPTETRTYELSCDIMNEASSLTLSRAFPTPGRTWLSQGDIMYHALTNVFPTARDIDPVFFMDPPNRALLIPDVIFPSVLQLSQGGVMFNFLATNVTMPGMLPAGITEDPSSYRPAIFSVIVGDWTCEANNTFGRDSATSTIRLCGAAPVIPGCSAETLFGSTGSVLPSGCNICIPEGDTITLDCTASSGTAVMYEWVNGKGDVLSNNPLLNVRQTDNYTCTASNIDNPSVLSASALFYSERLVFTGMITGRFGRVLSGTGCDRLSNRTGIGSDVLCVFVGEELNFNCLTDDLMKEPLMITDVFDAESLSPTNVTDVDANDAGTYSCRLSTNTGPCGQATTPLTVQVFEPARIDRTTALPVGCTYGAGRQTQEVVVAEGTTVVLCCPDSGREDPTTLWYRIDVDQYGMAMEMTVDQLEGPEAVGVPAISVTVGSDGTYVCRTSNNAGSDADIVTIRTAEESGIYVVGEFSACNFNCVDGVQTRSVICRSNRDGMILPDSSCSPTVPAASQSCANLFPNLCLLQPVWISNRWGTCIGGCHIRGYRSRAVVCQVPMTGKIMDDFSCIGQTKPDIYDHTGCPATCCSRDDFPRICRFHGPGFCGQGSFRRICCWTCKVTTNN